MSLAWIPIIFPSMVNASAIRAVRALRPLRSLKLVPGMPLLVSSIFKSLPALGNVAGLMVFIFVIFGIIGFNLFKGVHTYTWHHAYIHIMHTCTWHRRPRSRQGSACACACVSSRGCMCVFKGVHVHVHVCLQGGACACACVSSRGCTTLRLRLPHGTPTS